MILYFSGTGNSKFAAEVIASVTGDDLHDMTPDLRERKAPALHSEEPWVVVAPTYAWRLPLLVESWLRAVKLTGSKQVYFVLTCGSGTGDAWRKAKDLAEKCGYAYMGFLSVVMPENYVAMFKVPEADEAEEILYEAVPVLEKAGRAVLERKPFPREVPQAGGGFLTSVVNPVFYGLFVKDKKFFATDTCTGCGLCEKRCPMGNIRMKDGKPQWHGECTHCMACICRCPAKAIEYGRGTKGKRRWEMKEK
jgi:NAD-dependent dihydropyrimidine dehydrogenase PreA subunit